MNKKKKRFLRRLRKRLFRGFDGIAVFLLKYIVAYIYIFYMRLVWITSKVIEDSTDSYHIHEKPPYKAIGLVWHQDVFMVAYAYRNYPCVHTIASTGHAGEVITYMLKKCNFKSVVRGGSSQGKKRRRRILDEILDFMGKEDTKGFLGVTVDGASGPAYRVKTGTLVCAAQHQLPVYVSRAWAKRRIQLSTWDKTMIPLPFNKIMVRVVGPFFPPENFEDPEVFDKFHEEMQNKQLQITYDTFQKFEEMPPELMALFPENWQPIYSIEPEVRK